MPCYSRVCFSRQPRTTGSITLLIFPTLSSSIVQCFSTACDYCIDYNFFCPAVKCLRVLLLASLLQQATTHDVIRLFHQLRLDSDSAHHVACTPALASFSLYVMALISSHSINSAISTNSTIFQLFQAVQLFQLLNKSVLSLTAC